jgi:polysaccharide biosynthesis transport protein
VLVDANLRNPTVHERFGLTNKVGLSTLLTDQQLTTSARDLLQKTHEPLLSVLTAGPAIAAPAEALASPALATIIEQIGAHAYVVIDSPAVLNASEVAIIASRSERALMVVAARQTSAANLKRAMETLSLADVSVPGIILNRVEKEYLR